MDWTRIITQNRPALMQIVAEIAALLDYAITGTAILWPHQVQAEVRRLLRRQGWRVIVVWECRVQNNETLEKWLQSELAGGTKLRKER